MVVRLGASNVDDVSMEVRQRRKASLFKELGGWRRRPLAFGGPVRLFHLFVLLVVPKKGLIEKAPLELANRRRVNGEPGYEQN